jgi:hypothetical protein
MLQAYLKIIFHIKSTTDKETEVGAEATQLY